MTADLALMPAHQLVKLYKARKASPVEAVRAALARIEAFNPQLNAFQHLDPDGALRAARASEKRWKKGGKRLSDIDGVPVTIKDMVLTKGLPTRMGSLATDAEANPFLAVFGVAIVCSVGALVTASRTPCTPVEPVSAPSTATPS